MDDKIAKLWHWHDNLQSVLNDIREAQALIKREDVGEFITRLDKLITKADNLADNIMAEMYADSDDTLRNLGELAKMLLKLNKGEKLSNEDVEYLGYLINDAEDAHKFDNFCDETEYLQK